MYLIYAARTPWPVVFLLSWFQVQEVADELRIRLRENALTKKTQEQRLKILASAFKEIRHDSARTRVSPQTLYPIKIEFHFFCGNTTSLYIDLKEMFICTKIRNANAIKFVLLTFLTFNRCSPWNRGILPQRWGIFGFSVNSCEYHNLHCWFFVSSTNARRGGVCVSENYDKPVINLFGYRSKANVYLQISVTLRRGFILFYTGMLCTVWH